jgi:hypothetical protein
VVIAAAKTGHSVILPALMRVEHYDDQTVIHLTAIGPAKPKKSRGEYFREYRAARVRRGLCRMCGRKRRRYRHRCDRCQKSERQRWAAAYPSGNWSWFRDRRDRYREQARIVSFLTRLERKESRAPNPNHHA